MTLLARTTKQQARDQRDKAVAADFCAFKKAYPSASMTSIARSISQSGKYQLTVEGVKRVLYRTGAVTPKARA